MNSQIYCLPQKYGWNAITGVSEERARQHELYINKKSTKPYFKTDINKTALPEIQEEVKRVYPKMAKHVGPDSCARAVNSVYTSETKAEFDGHATFPAWTQVPVASSYESHADPARLQPRPNDPPMDTVQPQRGTYGNDPQTGRHAWLRLQSEPGAGVWEAPVRQTYDYSERSTLPPVRVMRHDPNNEKYRWDVTRNLSRNDALSYGYRRQVPGFTGHQQVVEHLDSSIERDVDDSRAMEATTQATYKELPLVEYRTVQQINKHQGPLSRMVTLTHPFNPFTQQTAYCTVGSKDTQ